MLMIPIHYFIFIGHPVRPVQAICGLQGIQDINPILEGETF